MAQAKSYTIVDLKQKNNTVPVWRLEKRCLSEEFLCVGYTVGYG